MDIPREFYTLLRSRTPSGESILPVATRRPYGDPGGPFYYRLVRAEASVVAKDHLVYELSPERLQRLMELFVDVPFSVSELPGYDSNVSANPFKVFAELPVQSRYRFLLDDARFFIEGFIKGPVCRGQVALNSSRIASGSSSSTPRRRSSGTRGTSISSPTTWRCLPSWATP